MYDSARAIFDYLPIRQNQPENDYTNHLWESFVVLDNGNTAARPFMTMPFHLLFMLAIQYKVLRIYKEQKDRYDLALTIKNPRKEEKDILTPESPLTIAFLGESEIVDLLKIAGMSTDDVRNIKKSIIRYRNDKIAHAKGYIEQNAETKIDDYFGWLRKLQNVYQVMNLKIANAWLEEIQDEDDMEQFLETHFLGACLSPSDFGNIIKTLLISERLNFDQWSQLINKGLELSYGQTILALHEIANSDIDDNKKFSAIRVLHENGEVNEELKENLIKTTNDAELLELLKQKVI